MLLRQKTNIEACKGEGLPPQRQFVKYEHQKSRDAERPGCGS